MISWYIDSSCIPFPSLRPTRSTSGRTEELLRLPKSVGQGVDLRARVVEVQRRAGARVEPEPAVERTGTVVTGSYGHTVRGQDLAHVVRVDLPSVQAVERERQGSAAVRGRGRAEEPQALDLAQLRERVLEQLVLVRVDLLETDVADVVDRRRQTGRLGDRHRAGLELVRRRSVRRTFHRHGLDHLTAAEERRERLQQLAASP